MHNKKMKSNIDRCAQTVQSHINSIFAKIELISKTLEASWKESLASHVTPTTHSIQNIKNTADSILTQNNPFITGTGVIFNKDALADQPLHIEWRHFDEKNNLVSLHLNFNERSESHYNYLKKEWFTAPQATNHCYIEGPYIDIFGQNSYILTFACPIVIDGSFIGVAGADVDLIKLERVLLTCLIDLPKATAIVNSENRVIASNSSKWSVGEIANNLLLNKENACRRLKFHEQQATEWKLIETPYD